MVVVGVGDLAGLPLALVVGVVDQAGVPFPWKKRKKT